MAAEGNMHADVKTGLILLILALPAVAQPVLRWGGDSEGGAPFVEADPNDPEKVMGFDVEVAEEIARALGRKPQFVQVSFAAIDQSVQRGDFDIGMSGVEDTPARRRALAASIPYYTFTEALTVRKADKTKYDELADLRGRRVGTLGGTIAYDLLLEAEKKFGIEAVSYDDDVHPYEDVANGRLDAVLLDNIIATRAMHRTKGLHTHFDKPVAKGHYIIVTARGNEKLRDKVNEILKARMRDGTLKNIYIKWGIWDPYQQPFFNEVLAAQNVQNVGRASDRPAPAKNDGLKPVLRYLPALLRAALVTIAMSCLSMALAVIIGMLVATGRVYGNALVRGILTAYVEIVRGTPVLLQLFVLYYGLSSVVKLPAFVAAMIGLGLNYAAYESEIYRGAMEAISRSQLEAARTLGLTEFQVFRFVRGPQAFRLALAPMTNDFVALLKDSSLVSVITVVELTKQTQIFAANVGSWAIPGAICAALYLAMSLPLARLARHMEGRWKAAGV
jgi:polar amino acid transport system substrate-binding protein